MYVYLAGLFAAGVLVQAYLAGIGIYSASTPERPHAAAAAQGGAGSVIEIQMLRALASAAVGQETAAAEAPVHWRRQ